MPIRRFLFATLAAAPLALVAIDSNADAAESGMCSTSREPPRTPPVVPGVIVLGAIAAAVVRLNRRGPR